MSKGLTDFVKSVLRPNKLKVFVVLTFTFAGYWLGRLSGNCMTAKYAGLYVRTGKVQTMLVRKQRSKKRNVMDKIDYTVNHG